MLVLGTQQCSVTTGSPAGSKAAQSAMCQRALGCNAECVTLIPRSAKDIFDISQAECEPQIQPDCELDDIGRKAMAPAADLAQAASLSGLMSLGTANLTSPL